MFELQVNEDVQLKLRDESHAEETFWLIKRNPHLRNWMQWYDKVRSVEDSMDNIIANIEDWEMKTDLHLGIFCKESVIGMISLHAINHIVNKAAIGYWIDKDYEGKGIITESTRALIEHGFEELDLHRIEIGAGVTNHRSRAIPERLGFKLEGVMRENILLNGQYIDMAFYGLLKREYYEQKIKNQR